LKPPLELLDRLAAMVPPPRIHPSHPACNTQWGWRSPPSLSDTIWHRRRR
jgi:hypothetical protein